MKIGDKVRYRSKFRTSGPIGFGNGITTIKCMRGKSFYLFDIGIYSGERCPCGKHTWTVSEGQLELVTSDNKSIMASLKEKMALVFKGEPEKSFIKAGVMNNSEELTEDGWEIFGTWLLKKNGADFKTEVVDPILADQEK